MWRKKWLWPGCPGAEELLRYGRPVRRVALASQGREGVKMEIALNEWLGRAETMGREAVARKMLRMQILVEKVSEATGLQRAAVQEMRDALAASREDKNRNPKGKLPTPDEAFDLYCKFADIVDLATELPARGIASAEDLAASLCASSQEMMERYGGEAWGRLKAEAEELAKRQTLLDPIPFFLTFRGEKALLSRLLQAITGKRQLKIKKLSMGLSYQVWYGKGRLVLDCNAMDAAGNTYNIDPQTDAEEANDGRALGHIAFLNVEGPGVGLGTAKPHEIWSIFLCSGDPKEKGELLDYRGFAEDRGKFLGNIAYLSSGVARALTEKNAGWQSPQDGIQLERWQDLLRWGCNLAAQSADEIHADDKLRQAAAAVLDANAESGQSLLTEELLRWYAKAYIQGKKEAAKNLFEMDLSEMIVCLATGLDGETVRKVKASLDD